MKFNFLDPYSGLDKIIADVRKANPGASDIWVRRQAKAILIEQKARKAFPQRRPAHASA